MGLFTLLQVAMFAYRILNRNGSNPCCGDGGAPVADAGSYFNCG